MPLSYLKNLLAYMDVFADNFIGLVQSDLLLQAIGNIFWLFDEEDELAHCEPVSIKKLQKED